MYEKPRSTLVQGAPKPMSDCPERVEILFGHENLWHNLSVGQAHFQFLIRTKKPETVENWLQITVELKFSL